MKNLKDILDALSYVSYVNETFGDYTRDSLVDDLTECRIRLENAFDENVDQYYQETGNRVRKLLDDLNEKQLSIVYNLVKTAFVRLYEIEKK